MSTNPSPVPRRPNTQPGADAEPGEALELGDLNIRQQAAAIIDAVLTDDAPEQAEIRKNLRTCLSNRPGQPELALAEHLIAVRSLPKVPYTGRTVPQEVDSAAQPIAASSSRSAEDVKQRIRSVLKNGLLVTAFQPIFQLPTGSVIGAQALTRFVSDGGDTAETWFAEASQAQLGSDLEFAALESALDAARNLPAGLYVALKMSASTFRNPLLPGLLEQSSLGHNRTVLELTDFLTAESPEALAAVVAPLRRDGFRLSLDHAGSYFSSIRHIRCLRPDIIKLERSLIAGIDRDPVRRTLGAAMVGFADQVGAQITAQGIETRAELATVTELGMTSGQGYFLGRPTTLSQDWKRWTSAPAEAMPGLEPHWTMRS